MERHYHLGDYHYQEEDWKGLPPLEVKHHVETYFRDGWILWALYERYMSRCVDYLIGRNRITFMFPTYVVKLPWCGEGFGDNDWEGSVSNIPDAPANDWQVQYARTRMHYEGEVPVVFMERVQPLTLAQIVELFGREPEWVGCVDCGQVGINRAGKLVAFDYGIN